MAAGAAPRPDAEPVTNAHKPSFDIRSLLLFGAGSHPTVAYHIARQSPGKSKLRCVELAIPPACMPPSQAALRRALVRAMAFPHHKAQEKTAPDASANSR